MNKDDYNLTISDPPRIFNSFVHCLQSIRVKTCVLKKIFFKKTRFLEKCDLKVLSFESRTRLKS